MKLSLRIFSVLAIIVLAGCQAVPPPAPQQMTISCTIPTITTLPETKESQEKGGVEIAIVPTLYKTAKKSRVTLKQVNPPLVAVLVGGDVKNKVYTEETTTSFLQPDPARLQFTVRVNNKLSRVFRGQGAVVQINVAGKMIPFGNTDYKEFIEGIVPPRNEAEFTIYGPTMDMLPEKGTIGIFLYDVVTATDVAGNVTDKQNYEWYFSYETTKKEETADIQTKQGFMDVMAYQLELQQIGNQQQARGQ